MRESPQQSAASRPRRVRQAWAELTGDEQRAVLVVLALAVLGITVRLWHAVADFRLHRIHLP